MVEHIRDVRQVFGSGIYDMAQSQQVQRAAETTVDVRATGHVRDALGTAQLSFTFEGDTLREFVEAFFAEHDVRELVIAETDDEAATRGWAPIDGDDVPGDLRKNPAGEQTRAYARILINGEFNEMVAGFDTKLSEGDRVALVNPFVFCV
jgi:molybdopterin converting factor small subunit